MQNLTGQTIDRYHILEQIGEGGMAVVYKAFDSRLQTEVALKIIQTDAFPAQSLARMLARFQREAQTLARLQHSNIIGIIDYGEYEQTPYLVMEYLPGGTLKQLLGEPMPFKKAAAMLLPIAQALGHAHKQGIIHRDIKPSNILFSPSGDPMLTDFGIAKLIQDADETHTLTDTGVGIGTPDYMAPEQGLGKPIDARADIYSLGIIFYELITGQKPFSAETPMAVILKHMTDPLPNPAEMIPGLPPQVVKVLLKAVAKKTKNRYKSMADFAKALQLLVAIPDTDMAKMASAYAERVKKNKMPVKSNNIEQRNLRGKLIWGVGVIILIFSAIIIYQNTFPSRNTEAVITSNTPTPSQSSIKTTLIPTVIVQSIRLATNTPTIVSTSTIIPTPENPFLTINENNIKDLSLEIVLPFGEGIYGFFYPPLFSFSPDGKSIAMVKNELSELAKYHQYVFNYNRKIDY